MADIYRVFNVSRIPYNGNILVIPTNQYEKGEKWIFTLYESDTPMQLTETTKATIEGTKPDGTGFVYNCTVNLPQGAGYGPASVSFVVEEQVNAVAGDVIAELRLVDGDVNLGTYNFIVRVERSALEDESAISETDIPIFRELAQQTQTNAMHAENAEIGAREAQHEVEQIVNALRNYATVQTLTSSDTLAGTTEAGFYYIGSSQPSDVISGQDWTNSYVIVITDGTNVQQHIIKLDGVSINAYTKLYHMARQMNNGVWGSWTNLSFTEDSGWITLNATAKTYYRRKNGMVCVVVANAGNQLTNNQILGQLPVGYRPAYVATARNRFDNANGGIVVETSGNVAFQTNQTSGTANYVQCTITYPV